MSAPARWEGIRRAGPLPGTMVTDVLELTDVSAAMDIQDTGNCGKILLLPHGTLEESR